MSNRQLELTCSVESDPPLGGGSNMRPHKGAKKRPKRAKPPNHKPPKPRKPYRRYDLRLAESKKPSSGTPTASPAGSLPRTAGKKRTSLASPALLAAGNSARKGTPLSVPRLSSSKAGGGRMARAAASGVSPAVIDFPTKGIPQAAADDDENVNVAQEGRASKRARV